MIAAFLRQHLPHGLRRLAACVLALGLLLQPLLGAQCEIRDLGSPVGDGSASMIAIADQGDASTCCPGQQCGECCTVATVVPMMMALLPVMHVRNAPLKARFVDFSPTPYPVAIRPPITV